MTIYNDLRLAQREAIVDGTRPDENFVVRLKAGLGTAVWLWQPPHRIFVGDQILARLRPDADEADRRHYVASYLLHEFSHARHTCRDHAGTKTMINRVGCSFGLLNLFEDARIEQLWRERTGRQFRWAALEQSDPAHWATPSGAFLTWIQWEGRADLISRLEDSDFCAEVESFYRRAVAAPDTLALEPLLAEWLARYGDSDGEGRFLGSEGNADGEFEIQSQLALSAEALAAFEADCREVDSAAALGDSLGSVEIDGSESGGLLAAEEAGLSEDEAHRHATALLRVMTIKARTSYALSPGARLSAWRSEAGRPAYRRRTGERVVRRHRTMIVDCSGSMDGEHIAAARTLVRTMSLLAERGALEGELILCAVHRSRALSESFAWPVRTEVARRIHAFGSAEGICDAIEAHTRSLVRAEKVFVFTDGDICDRPLNFAALRRAGVEVIGLYVGPVEKGNDALKRHFDRFAVRETLGGLVEFLLMER